MIKSRRNLSWSIHRLIVGCGLALRIIKDMESFLLKGDNLKHIDTYFTLLQVSI